MLGTAAWCAQDLCIRSAALDEGAALLEQGCVGHNYYRFYTHAIEASLLDDDTQSCARWATALEDYTRQEPNPWADFYIDFARLRCQAPTDVQVRAAEALRLLQCAQAAGFARETDVLKVLAAPQCV